MHRNRWIGYGVLTLAVAGSMIAVSSTDLLGANAAELKEPLETMGVVFVIIGFGLIVWPFIPERAHKDYDPRRAKRGDLKVIYDLCNRVFDGEVSSFNKMKQWFNHNKNIFYVIEEIRRKAGFKRSKIVGYYSIIPLTKSAATLVKKEELYGTDFTTEHIAKETETPAAYYIGGVAAKGWRAKGVAVNYLKGKALDLHDNVFMPFLTRPITRDGLRLAQKYDFFPIRETTKNPMSVVHIRIKE